MSLTKQKIRRVLKYLIHWIIIFAATKYIPSGKLTFKEVTMVAMVGAISFAILDLYVPVVADNCRKQIGYSLGIKTLIS